MEVKEKVLAFARTTAGAAVITILCLLFIIGLRLGLRAIAEMV